MIALFQCVLFEALAHANYRFAISSDILPCLIWDDLPWMLLAALALWSCAPCSTLQLCQRSKILLTGGLVGACGDLERAPCCWKIQLSKKDQKVGWHMIKGTSKKGAIEVLPLIQQALY